LPSFFTPFLSMAICIVLEKYPLDMKTDINI
jgi:hypothetical protein